MSNLVSLNLTIGDSTSTFVMDDLNGRDYTVDWLKSSSLPFYELPLPTIIMALAQEAKGVFLDVGANTGVYALLAASANPDLQTYAFEPVPVVREVLEVNISHNTLLAGRIRVVPQAMSDKAGHAIIYQHINSNLVPMSSSLKPDFHDYEAVTAEVEIESDTLDAWVRRQKYHDPLFHVDFMKVDVEGHEAQAIAGAERLISVYRPIIVIELLRADYPFFADLIQRHNYIDIALYPGEAKRLAFPRFEEQSWNHVLVPVERAWQFAVICARTGLPISAE